MASRRLNIGHSLFLLIVMFSVGRAYSRQSMVAVHADRFIESERLNALSFLDSIQSLPKSKYWPNVDPALLMLNLRAFTQFPLQFYEGKGTNFCAYSGITYLPLQHDPLGFARFMVKLYLDGEADMGKAHIKPGKAVRKEAGLIKYKGALDINHAGQIWFLSLADHFKGYINIFNRRYQKGDENTLWASTNFAKFNRMLRRLFPYKVKAKGSDLLRPWIKDVYGYLRERINAGPIFLYLNNRLLYKKRHTTTKLGIPTHYVLLLDIYKTPQGLVNIVYWDYGRKTLQQVTPRLLKKIVYGITLYYPNENR
ncbi:MAG: hypothetical protein ACK4E0_17490 [Chitinophagaceae bacterium]